MSTFEITNIIIGITVPIAHHLKEIFFRYGEEKTSKNIAKKIVEYRKNKNIEIKKKKG